MATPNYKGAGQPSNGGSWLGSWLGGTPAYKTAEKGASASSYTGAGPAYKPAPVAAQSPDAVTPASADENDTCGPGPIAIVIPREMIEQQ
jgi:hypothetical protein